ncbi:unnamed protein product [Prorocentrum cordatum]|uniref:Uncharacterized protein n=1 Tax=Prorocentrum cordatum TaxID=2364126 RepID=A0ABN9UT01_9DINO|nr:unnamed protein product [Polarella glacialis]
MRVRHLQTLLVDHKLINSDAVSALGNLRVGIDVVYWLRSIQSLKDAFADAIGGIPPGIFFFVDKELEWYTKCGITPVFVFQGVSLGPPQAASAVRMDQQMDMAWTYLKQGYKSEAQKCFAVSTSRINSDFVYLIFHHLKQRGCEVLQAPYLAGAQLAHFAQQRCVDMVYGPPGLLLYGIPQVIVAVDWGKGRFDWVSLEAVLTKWTLTKDQFIDVCLLAGTEHCLTYPYLTQVSQGSSCRFSLDAAIQLVKQAPLMQWMANFPNDQMREEHIESYSISKVLVNSAPILHVRDACIRPLDEAQWPGQDLDRGGRKGMVPRDFSDIVGQMLPDKLYFLMVQGIISSKLPQALAKGEWLDKSQPFVDTAELRGLITDLSEYRQVALGLVARHLHASYTKKSIRCNAFWEPPWGQAGEGSALRSIQPKKLKATLRWRFCTEDVDLKFCLRWHAHEHTKDGQFVKNLTKFGESQIAPDLLSLSALVHFMLLEHLELIGDDGGITHLGDVLKDSPTSFQEPVLVAMELMKFGLLTAEPFEPGQPDMPFPEQLQLKNHSWNANVVFDLAAFHCFLKVLRRTLRQMTEAVLTSILLKDISLVSLLPSGFLCATPRRGDPVQTPAVLPTFMVPRACMGVVALYPAACGKGAHEFESDLAENFPCCAHPLADLKLAILFWEDLRRCVDGIAEPLGATELAEDVKVASKMLLDQQRRLHVFPDQGDVSAARGEGPAVGPARPQQAPGHAQRGQQGGAHHTQAGGCPQGSGGQHGGCGQRSGGPQQHGAPHPGGAGRGPRGGRGRQQHVGGQQHGGGPPHGDVGGGGHPQHGQAVFAGCGGHQPGGCPPRGGGWGG